MRLLGPLKKKTLRSWRLKISSQSTLNWLSLLSRRNNRDIKIYFVIFILYENLHY